MNRQQLYTLSGVLLASTALAGLAEAATVGKISAHAATSLTGFSTTSVKVANTIFSTTATTADAISVGGTSGLGDFAIKFTNTFTNTTKFSIEIDVSGANFVTSALGTTDLIVNEVSTAGGSFYSTIATSIACSSTTPLVSKIIIDGCQLSSMTAQTFTSGTTGASTNHSVASGGILLSGVTFNTANALATVGNAIALSGSVYNTSNPSQSFETITSTNIIASQAPLTATVTACTNVVASPTATPAAFEYLSTTNGVSNSDRSMCLATVTITGSGAYNATLTTQVDASNVASSVVVTVTDTVLGSAAVANVYTSGSAGVINNQTAANFSGGSATFAVATTAVTQFTINLTFTGSTAIPTAAAGTVSIAYGSGAANGVQAAATATGGTAQISRGGFNAELNTFLSSSNTSFTSFARLHNMGVAAGTATITVVNDATGAQLGSSFTTATVAAGQTLQLSNKDIETAAGITAASGVNYTIQITGPFIGYAQHIIFNPATGQLADLSGFRNHDAGSANSP